MKTRNLVVCAILSAISAILMLYIEFSVPFMPFFIKLDISDLPALIASFALGPFWGGAVCFIKNLINLPTTYSAGIGELANFLMSASFVITAGVIYKKRKTKKYAVLSSLIGSFASAAVSFPVNLFITYPIYSRLMPIKEILAVYQAISGIKMTLPQCLLLFNVPFTLLKCLIISIITIFIYKRLSPIIKGKR